MEVYEETFESISFMLEKRAKAKKVDDDDVLDMFADSLDDDPKVALYSVPIFYLLLKDYWP